MSYTAIQGTPIFVDLVAQANDTGWSISDNIASHSSCNAGKLRLTGYTTVAGVQYTVTYRVDSISGGYVALTIGGVEGTHYTTTGLKTQVFTAISGTSYFYSNANCDIEIFTLQINPIPITNNQKNTIAFSERTGKWGSWYTFVPDIGMSLNVDSYTYQQGILYIHESGTGNRCNFYGTQFPATVVFTTNEQPSITKTYISLNYQADQLLITAPTGGIKTANGQISDLVPSDFIQAEYNNGVKQYDSEGLYNASFMRDINTGIVNGDILQGNWCEIALQTSSPSTALNLYSTVITYQHSYQNIR